MGTQFRRTAIACAFISVPFAALADRPDSHDSQPITQSSTTTGRPSEALSSRDLRVLALMHQANRQEIEAGQLAEQRGATPAIRRYGRMLIDDHDANDRMILAFARNEGQILPEVTPRDEEQAMSMRESERALEHLRGLQGAAFDHEFLRAMIISHDKTIARVDAEISSVDDPEVAQMLRAALPVLHKHLDVAHELMRRT